MPVAPGIIFGHYEVLVRLGAGGMGEVYRARDRRLERYVAIKSIPASFAHDPERLNRFISEAKILASLNHPNIGAIYGIEEFLPGEHCLILELVEGVSLLEQLQHGPLPIGKALRLGAEIAEALEAAHEKGVIHRDLKPGNVMLTNRGGIKLLDFGLARQTKAYFREGGTANFGDKEELVSEDVTASITRIMESKDIEGTPGYMSPEQIRGDEQDQRTDIFAFGCVLYECLAGRRAFKGEDSRTVMAAILTDEPLWQALPDETPPAVRELLGKCLEKDASRRPDRIKQVRSKLEEICGMKVAEHGELAEVPNNLPKETSSFVGREKELAECEHLINKTRLVTLIGIGGCGKTRLALKLAGNLLRNFPDGVWFVDLAPISDPTRVPLVMASALDVKEESAKSLIGTLVSHLKYKQALIILDNCENLLAACSEIAKMLLEACSNLKILLTSRESPGLRGEHIFLVQPLSTPDKELEADPQAVLASEAGRLFVDRAYAWDIRFELNSANCPAVADICRKLDGIPLAIELAANRIRMLTVDQIRDRLNDRFRLLTADTGAILPRHQTLAAVIQWSYDHLTAEEQRLFRTISVFKGGWTLSAVTAIAGGEYDEFAMLDALTRLADKALIIIDRGWRQEARYYMLETVKQYAHERLNESGEGNAVRARHFDYFLSLAKELDHQRQKPSAVDWRQLMDRDLENMLSAHNWCNQAEERAEDGLKLGFALRNYWLPRGFLDLGFRTSLEALNRPGAAAPTLLRGKMLLTAGILAYFTGRYGDAGKYLDESLSIMREKAERSTLSITLTGLALVAHSQEQHAPALNFLMEAVQIARETGDRGPLVSALNTLGDVYRAERKYEEATAAYEESLENAIAAGNAEDAGVSLCNLGRVWINRGELDRSERILGELLDRASEIGSNHVFGGILDVAAGLMLVQGKSEPGIRIYGAADALLEHSNLQRDITDDKFLAPLVSLARESLGTERYQTTYDIGRRLTPKKAFDEIRAWLAKSPNI
jgi:non-specific serine/threonine protein kinase